MKFIYTSIFRLGESLTCFNSKIISKQIFTTSSALLLLKPAAAAETIRRPYTSITITTTKCTNKMEKIKVVDIDPTDTFKYILLKFNLKTEPSKRGEEPKSILLVRGYTSCPYHSDIYDVVHEAIGSKLGKDVRFELKCLGGGRIKHEHGKIHVYGYSQGYGKADHKVTTDILKANFPGLEVTWSDEGY